jgi:hypothetical protein
VQFDDIVGIGANVIGGRVSDALRNAIDPRTGKKIDTLGQHHGYQVWDEAWVHARHGRHSHMALKNATRDGGSYPPEMLHPKQAYMRGLLDSRLRLSGSAGGPSTEAPAARRLPSGRVAPPWTLMTRELWDVVSKGDPLALTQPDNAYMMGAVDGAFRYLE